MKHTTRNVLVLVLLVFAGIASAENSWEKDLGAYQITLAMTGEDSTFWYMEACWNAKPGAPLFSELGLQSWTWQENAAVTPQNYPINVGQPNDQAKFYIKNTPDILWGKLAYSVPKAPSLARGHTHIRFNVYGIVEGIIMGRDRSEPVKLTLSSSQVPTPTPKPSAAFVVFAAGEPVNNQPAILLKWSWQDVVPPGAIVDMVHIYNGTSYVGQPSSPTKNSFEWRAGSSDRIDPAFINGPQAGLMYNLRIAVLFKNTSTLWYDVESVFVKVTPKQPTTNTPIPLATATPTVIPKITNTPISIPVFTATPTVTPKPTYTPTQVPTPKYNSGLEVPTNLTVSANAPVFGAFQFSVDTREPIVRFGLWSASENPNGTFSEAGFFGSDIVSSNNLKKLVSVPVGSAIALNRIYAFTAESSRDQQSFSAPAVSSIFAPGPNYFESKSTSAGIWIKWPKVGSKTQLLLWHIIYDAYATSSRSEIVSGGEVFLNGETEYSFDARTYNLVPGEDYFVMIVSWLGWNRQMPISDQSTGIMTNPLWTPAITYQAGAFPRAKVIASGEDMELLDSLTVPQDRNQDEIEQFEFSPENLFLAEIIANLKFQK